MNPITLLDEWHTGIRVCVMSHHECAKRNDGYHQLLGWPLVVFSAVAGTSAVSSMNDSGVGWQRILAVSLSMLVTVLASLQTFLRYSEQAQQHKAAAVEFGKLRRELEQMLALLPAGTAPDKAQMDAVRVKWGDLSSHAPSIPNRIYWGNYRRVVQGKAAKNPLPASPANPVAGNPASQPAGHASPAVP